MLTFAGFRSHFRENILLAYPVMLSQLGHVIVQVADTVMIGRILGPTALASAAFANGVFAGMAIFFGVGLSYAITPLVAKADGEGNKESISGILRHGVVINLIAGLVICAILLCARFWVNALDQPEEVVAMGLPYLNIIAFSIIPLMIFQTFRQFAEGLSRTRMAMVIVIGANLINIGLNYVFMKGLFGISPMGVNGAGWATLISRVIMAVCMALYVYQANAFRPLRSGWRVGNYSRGLFSKMLHIGIPAGMQYIFEAGAFSVSFVMMGWISADAVASHQIALNLATISYMMATGFAAAATVRVGNQFGRKDRVVLREAAFSLLVMGVIFMSLWALIFLAGRETLASWYIDDATVIRMAGPLIVIAGFFQISDGAQVVMTGACRGLQDVKVPMWLILIAYWIIALPLGYVMSFTLELGAIGIWIGLLGGLTITAVLMFIRFNRLSKTVPMG
jgi:MATE family multidrug resistance protein